MRFLLYSLLFIVFTSCTYGDFNDKITGDYGLFWNNQASEQCICKSTSFTGCTIIIPEYVFAVGHDDGFIIAKQHPVTDSDIDTLVTNYYIIDIRREDDEIYGPMQKAVFDGARQKFGIRQIEFDMVYPKVP